MQVGPVASQMLGKHSAMELNVLKSETLGTALSLHPEKWQLVHTTLPVDIYKINRSQKELKYVSTHFPHTGHPCIHTLSLQTSSSS